MSTVSTARYWLGTLYDWTPPRELPAGSDLVWLRGQQERCPTTGRLHHQIFAAFSKNQRLSAVKAKVGAGHWEPSRSEAAEAYVWKEQTRVPDTQFELGARAVKRNSKTDWDQVLAAAKRGDFTSIPSDVQVRYYRTLQSIAVDHQEPIGVEKVVNVYHGRSGTGKSRRAWEEGGINSYAKVTLH